MGALTVAAGTPRDRRRRHHTGPCHDTHPRIGGLGRRSPRNWLLDRAERTEIGRLLGLVPAELAGSLAVLEARVHHGPVDDLVTAARERFRLEQSAEPLYLGAAGLAVRGHRTEALQWLDRAVAVGPDPNRLATDPAFRSLHGESGFQQLRGRAERAVGLYRTGI
ncbi:MAG: hypothetical protein R2698_12705 [Microthrixaceae bacterium]